MKHDNFTTWCLVATARIRFRPDRQAVYDELHAHLEDHRDALIEKGMDENEATQKALESMGSATHIAPQLAAIHKPFWGYVESVAKVLAITLAVLVLFCGLISLFSLGVPWENNAERDNFAIMETSQNKSLDIQTEITAKIDQYTYTVTRVAIFPHQSGYGECLIRVDVVGGAMFSESHPPLSLFTAADNNGNLYYSDDEAYQADSRLQVLSPQVFPFHSSYDLIIRGYDPSATEWIELHYNRDGREAVLHIDLTGGAA